MILVSVPWFVVVAYWIGFAACWRTLTGHVAWSVHRTANTNKTIRPPTENWLVASIPCALLSLVWPAVLLFAIPWIWPAGAEKEAVAALGRIEFDQLEAKGTQYAQIEEQSWDEKFANLKGEVVDD